MENFISNSFLIAVFTVTSFFVAFRLPLIFRVFGGRSLLVQKILDEHVSYECPGGHRLVWESLSGMLRDPKFCPTCGKPLVRQINQNRCPSGHHKDVSEPCCLKCGIEGNWERKL